jgi:hypothetical protein
MKKYLPGFWAVRYFSLRITGVALVNDSLSNPLFLITTKTAGLRLFSAGFEAILLYSANQNQLAGRCYTFLGLSYRLPLPWRIWIAFETCNRWANLALAFLN